MTRRFEGKVAIVAGGSSGIGAAVAHGLAAEGAKVAVVASASLDKAAAVADAIGAAGGEASAYVADVRDAGACLRLAEEVGRRWGTLDLLFNGAGIFFPTPAGGADAKACADLVNVNVIGVWNMVAAAVPMMAESGGGRIVNVSSTAAFIGVNGFALYCASKAAVSMMTRALAAELAPQRIAINAIAPGNTATPMNAEVRANPDAMAAMLRMTPSGTAFTDVADMASIALFLLSDDARAVHGATWLADEGISAAIGG
jgi:3-oxoacyl-[acyl-carrier protein] reductase